MLKAHIREEGESEEYELEVHMCEGYAARHIPSR